MPNACGQVNVLPMFKTVATGLNHDGFGSEKSLIRTWHYLCNYTADEIAIFTLERLVQASLNKRRKGEGMNVLLLCLAVIIVASILLSLKLIQSRQDRVAGYESRSILFTPAERSFLGVLEQALDSRYRVFAKVRLGDLVKPVKGLDAGKRSAAMNRINQKHVDFVICTASELSPVGVLELDDHSHERGDRVARDKFVDQVLASAGIPVLNFPARKGYAVQYVRTRLAEMMHTDAKSSAVSTAVPLSAAPDLLADGRGVISGSALPLCPNCSAVMVQLTSLKGQTEGTSFWSCSAFSGCGQVMELGKG